MNPYQHGQYQQHPGAIPLQPVASRPIAGTRWLEVKTNLGYIYYFCQDTQASVWEKPKEVEEAERAEKKKLQQPRIDAKTLQALKRAKANGAKLAPEYEALLASQGSDGGSGEGKNKIKKKKRSASEKVKNEDDLQKRKKVGESMPEEFDVTFDEGDIVSEEEEGERVGAGDGVSAEQAEMEYRELLGELGIHGFSRFEKELEKMEHDRRFLAVKDPKKRRTLFDEFCAETARMARGKTARTAQASVHDSKDDTDAFKALLQEKVLHSDSSWQDIVHILEKDDRFTSVASEPQKRELFRNHRRVLEKVEYAKRSADRRMAKDIEAAKHRKLQSSKADAVNNFKALLAELVRNPVATWDDELSNLMQDPQNRASNPALDEKVAKNLFESHVISLYNVSKKCVVELYAKNKLPRELTFSEAAQCLSEDFDFSEYPEKIQAEAWIEYSKTDQTHGK